MLMVISQSQNSSLGYFHYHHKRADNIFDSKLKHCFSFLVNATFHDCHGVQKMINSIVAIIRERVNPILQFLQLVICKLNL